MKWIYLNFEVTLTNSLFQCPSKPFVIPYSYVFDSLINYYVPTKHIFTKYEIEKKTTNNKSYSKSSSLAITSSTFWKGKDCLVKLLSQLSTLISLIWKQTLPLLSISLIPLAAKAGKHPCGLFSNSNVMHSNVMHLFEVFAFNTILAFLKFLYKIDIEGFKKFQQKVNCLQWGHQWKILIH